MGHAPPSHFMRQRRFGMLAFMIGYPHALQECLCLARRRGQIKVLSHHLLDPRRSYIEVVCGRQRFCLQVYQKKYNGTCLNPAITTQVSIGLLDVELTPNFLQLVSIFRDYALTRICDFKVILFTRTNSLVHICKVLVTYLQVCLATMNMSLL